MPRRLRAPRRKRARRARKTRIPRSISSKHQMATCKETIEFQNITPNFATQLNFTLSMFSRASRMSNLFRWYKAASVTWKLEPMYNTYQSLAGNPAIPFVYTMMNRTQSGSALALGDFLAQGCKPRKLVGILNTTYKPNWCSPGLSSLLVAPVGGVPGGVVQDIYHQGLKPEFGWLATPDIPNTGTYTDLLYLNSQIGSVVNAGNNQAKIAAALTCYNGHAFYLEQKNGLSTVFCKLSATVTWVFKDPKYTAATDTTDTFKIDVSGNYVPTVPDI